MTGNAGRKVFQGAIVPATLALIPALGRPESFRFPQLWIMYAIGVCAQLFQPSYSPFASKENDHGTALQIVWTVYLTQVLAVIEAVYLRFPESFRQDWCFWIGFATALAGLALRTWAVFTLGEYFTWHVSVKSGQQVVRTGPYRFVRHPSYTGALLTYIFCPLALHSWVAMAAAIVALPLAFKRRIYFEEALMKNKLGASYEDYIKAVPGLLPFDRFKN